MPTTQYKLFQDRSIYRDICAPMTQQFCGVMKDQIISLSPDMGAGYFRYISPCKNVEMYVSDVTFRKRTVLKEQTNRESFSISFCISDILKWGKPGTQGSALLERGDCCVYENGRYEVENYYEAGLRYIGIGLNLHPDRFGVVTDHLLEKKAAVSPEMPAHKLSKYKMTKTVEALLHQILCCNYIDRLRFLYLEGKILELADGNDQVKEVASLVGYSNISHFSEAFQKKFGRTPSMYMKSFKQ